jgi:transposase
MDGHFAPHRLDEILTDPARAADRAETVPGVYQHYREHDGDGAHVSRNVKRWRSASMALRWTAAARQEAKKGFRRLKACKQLPAPRRTRYPIMQRHQTTRTNKHLTKQHELHTLLMVAATLQFSTASRASPLLPVGVATRYDKLAANYLAFTQLASIRLWLRADEFTP